MFAPPARAGQRAGVERGGAGGGPGPAPPARAGQRAGVEWYQNESAAECEYAANSGL